MIKAIFLLPVWLTAVLLIGCGTNPPRTDFSGLVDIGGGRKMYLECRGTGSPTVVLVSGTGGASDEWTHVFDSAGQPKPNESAVFPQIAKFTRVCIYDRPGTELFSGALTTSTSVSQPTTAQQNVSDLHSLLSAANEPGPFVLVGASWGGLIARLYAGTYPDQVAGIVMVDAASEFLKTSFTSDQWSDWMKKARSMLTPENAEVPDYEPSVQAVRDRPLARTVPAVVLSSDKPWDLQVGTTGSTWTPWLDAQARLADQLHARHISKTNSGHGIALEQPELVVEATHEIVDAVRNTDGN